MTVAPIAAIAGVTQTDVALLPTAAVRGGDFAGMLLDGVERVDQSIQHADRLALDFALDDSIPVHQVTVALEEARLSFELMLQVRSRLVEAYQELMRTQL